MSEEPKPGDIFVFENSSDTERYLYLGERLTGRGMETRSIYLCFGSKIRDVWQGNECDSNLFKHRMRLVGHMPNLWPILKELK